MCTNCRDDIGSANLDDTHRCLADPSSCIEDTGCPDLVDSCNCPFCDFT